MGKRLMIKRYGYIEVVGNVSDNEAIDHVKNHCSANDFDWGSPDWDDLQVVEETDDECAGNLSTETLEGVL